MGGVQCILQQGDALWKDHTDKAVYVKNTLFRKEHSGNV